MADIYDRRELQYVDHCVRQAHSLSRPRRHASDAVLSSAPEAPAGAEALPLWGTARPDLPGDTDA